MTARFSTKVIRGHFYDLSKQQPNLFMRVHVQKFVFIRCAVVGILHDNLAKMKICN
jgi:hypothetical protein